MLLRHVIPILVGLSVVTASIGVGFARGQSSAAGEIVICAGHAIVTISVDAQGNEVVRPGLCPDNGLLVFATFVLSGTDDASAPETVDRRVILPETAMVGASIVSGARARGPPVA